MGLYDDILNRLKTQNSTSTFDPQYDQTKQNIQTGIAGLQSQQEQTTRRNDEDYSAAVSKLGQQRETDLSNLKNRMANKGTLYSGADVTEQRKLASQYQDASAQLGQTKTRANEDLTGQITSKLNEYNTQLSQSQRDSADREAARQEAAAQQQAEAESTKQAADQQRVFMEDLQSKLLQSAQPQPTATGQFTAPTTTVPPDLASQLQQMTNGGGATATPTPPLPTAVHLVGPVNIQAQELQTLLQKGGYAPGPIDGKLGPKTAAALGRWKAANGIPVDGDLTMELVNQLRSQSSQFSVPARGTSSGMA